MELIVWLNAFIPANVPGYTKTITKGTHSGKTAIPLPGAARLNPMNWKDWNAGYLTDQRGFNQSPSASCRMQSLFKVKWANGKATETSSSHNTSGTTEVNIDTGEELQPMKPADMSRCAFGMLWEVPDIKHSARYCRIILPNIRY